MAETSSSFLRRFFNDSTSGFSCDGPGSQDLANRIIKDAVAGQQQLNELIGDLLGTILPGYTWNPAKYTDLPAWVQDLIGDQFGVDITGPIYQEIIDAGNSGGISAGMLVILRQKYRSEYEILKNDVADEGCQPPTPPPGGTSSDAGVPFSGAVQSQLRRLTDPIVLDLDGDGIELLSRESGSRYFDIDADGIGEWTGWVGSDDGFLAIDANGNGKIDNINELIGDQGRSGFAELITYDSNGDQTLSSLDAAWAGMRIWRDLDGDAVTDPGELFTLQQSGIASIDLRFTTVNFTAEGNRIHEQSTFVRTDGSFGSIVDVWLETDNVVSSSLPITTGNATIDALPEMRGNGDVPSLRTAMLQDGALTSLVSQIVALGPDQFTNLRALVENVIYRWTDTIAISTTSRGANFDGRKLEALEAYLGTEFNANGVTEPGPQAVPGLEAAWRELVDGVLTRLVMAGPLASGFSSTLIYLEPADLFYLTDTVDLPSTFLLSAPTDTLRAAYYWAAVLPAVGELAEDDNVDTAGGAYRTSVESALSTVGLTFFQDLLPAGVQVARLGPDSSLAANGVFTVTNANDTLYLTGSLQAVYGMAGNDRLVGITGGRYTLDGGGGADILQGHHSDDWLDGGTGVDTLYGGGGSDTYVVDAAGDTIVESRNGGTDKVRSTISYVLSSNLEHLVLLGTGAINGTGNVVDNLLTGNGAANVLRGLAGNDTLDGGAGADQLLGGLGSDTYWVDHLSDRVTEEGIGQHDVVRSTVSFVMPALVEEVFLLGTAAINAVGNDLTNYLHGNSGANLLDGRGGNDALYGSAGNDIYIVDHGSDGIQELANEGIDEIRASVSYTLSAHVERLLLTGGLVIDGAGNDLANILTGNGAANRLDGREGADTMRGGAGDDIYVVDHAGDQAIEAADAGTDTLETLLASTTLAAGIENLRLYVYGQVYDTTARNGTGNALANLIEGNNGTNVLNGGAGDDRLLGYEGDDRLGGGLGNDEIDGGGGADIMSGGTGDDVFTVRDATDRATELAGEGHDLVLSHVSFILGNEIEDVELVGAGALDARGNALANSLTGNDWDNNLDGAAGADIMAGQEGNDTYTVDSAGDLVVEAIGAGLDSVRSSVAYALGVGVENLVLLGTAALGGTGNELDNMLTGNAGANQLNGGFGRDVLKGEGGGDVLRGGFGVDQLTGGLGADRFVFDDAETTAVRWDCDRIFDFRRSESDRIDLRLVDSRAATAADEAFSFIGTSAFSNVAGQLRYETVGGFTYIEGDLDGNGTADMSIVLDGEQQLLAADFLL